jgi:hypothetical protein
MSSCGKPPGKPRRNIRLDGAFPVRVRGVDALGRHFKATTLADSFSPSGLYLQLPRSVGKGARLFTLMQLPGGAIVAARGKVLREEQKPHGLFGLAVRFTRARLLEAKSPTGSEQSENGSCL